MTLISCDMMAEQSGNEKDACTGKRQQIEDSFVRNPLQPKGWITDCTNILLILNTKKNEKN